MGRITFMTAVCGALLLTACASTAPTKEQAELAERRAQSASDRLIGALVGELTAAMREGGPVHAVQYCADNAQQVTALIADEERVQMRRVTDKTRNPADKPDAIESDALARLAAMSADGSLTPETAIVEVREVGGRQMLTYMRPLTIKKQCLGCHGSEEDVPDEVAAVIGERYPDDMATGYRVGDLRGAISVRVELGD